MLGDKWRNHCLCLSVGSSQGGGEASGEAAEGKRGRGKTDENRC